METVYPGQWPSISTPNRSQRPTLTAFEPNDFVKELKYHIENSKVI
jgi:hypothetical protein